jgi:hypothetical protein
MDGKRKAEEGDGSEVLKKAKMTEPLGAFLYLSDCFIAGR